MSFARVLLLLVRTFILVGLGITGYGAYGLTEGLLFQAQARGEARGILTRYEAGAHQSRVRPIGRIGTQIADPLIHFAHFSYQGRNYTDPTPQLFLWHDPGDSVVLLLPLEVGGQPRLADWPSRFTFAVAVMAFGLPFLVLPGFFLWAMGGDLRKAADRTRAVPSDTDPFQLPEPMRKALTTPILGRISPLGMIKWMLILLVAGTVAGLWSEYAPELRIGSEGRMLDALAAGDRKLALVMARQGKGINAKDEYEETALIKALDVPDPELARALVDSGAYAGGYSKTGLTPLFLAVYHDLPGMVELLLSHGAPPDDPKDPLFHAVSRDKVSMVQSFIGAGADLGRQINGLTPVDLAALKGHRRVLKLLLEAGGPTTLPEPCVWVAANDQRSIHRYVQDGGDVNLRCHNQSLVEFATRLKRGAIAALLAPAG